MTDLSVVLTAHSETAVCGPTVRSADDAIAAARAEGITVEAIVALDRATEATTAYFRQDRFDHWDRRVYDEGDLGRVRNAALPETSGRFIAFLDADDLFSENWLVEGVRRLRRAEDAGERVIAHPELNVQFDGAQVVLRNIAQRSPLFTPYFAYVRNYYDALAMAPREAHLEVPYGANDLSDGVGFEDWQFGLETMGAGWEHVIVPDTIIFKRRRDFSLVVESSSRKTVVRQLPAMAIDRVRDLNRF
ncbi:MAG TPA: glycosyltransferase family A protein [Marmoricola sp.]